jgi:hypothetical protein
MLGVFANDPHHTAAADHLALLTNLFDAGSDFHRLGFRRFENEGAALLEGVLARVRGIGRVEGLTGSRLGQGGGRRFDSEPDDCAATVVVACGADPHSISRLIRSAYALDLRGKTGDEKGAVLRFEAIKTLG